MTAGIKVKIFLGCKLDSKLKLLLSQSMDWKNARIEGQAKQSGWVETPHGGQDYIGLFLNETPVKVSELKKIQSDFLVKLQEFVPDIDVSNVKIVLFPKMFIK